MRVLLADDHTIVREGLKQVLKNMSEIKSIDEACDGKEALEKIEKDNYDLIILDISMPGLSGLDVLQIMKDKNEKAHILILSMHPQEQYARRAFKLGASGYLSKDSAFDELALAIKKISHGGKYISAELAEKLIFEPGGDINKLPHEKLSGREFQIMLLLAKGKSVTEIAGELFISDKTVSTHRSRLLEKMNLSKNAELTQYSIKNNLIE
ncbi:MAG: DNA-binding response regulator [Ignavibacteriae bacterium HGW-Ignavibacteriae-3]|nr:MAG: DNA-binding response regulator [Ignavibacteriae bacterium HGW-Ignavibacteriae-3]